MRKVGRWWGLSPFIGALQSCFKCCWETENLKSGWYCGHILHYSHPPPYPILHWPDLENSHGVEVEYCLWKQEDLSWIPAPAGHYCIDRGHFLSPISSSEKYTSPCYNIGLLWRLKEIWYLVLLAENEWWLFLQHLLHCTTRGTGRWHCSLCGCHPWCCIYATDLDRQSKQQFLGDFHAMGYMTARWRGCL